MDYQLLLHQSGLIERRKVKKSHFINQVCSSNVITNILGPNQETFHTAHLWNMFPSIRKVLGTFITKVLLIFMVERLYCSMLT